MSARVRTPCDAECAPGDIATVDGARGGLSRRTPRGEEGASLILALIFIVVIAALATVLTSWVSSDLNNTSKFSQAHALEAAANGATEAALQSIRHNFDAWTINPSTPQPCWQTGSPKGQITIAEPNDPITFAVWCNTFLNPLSTNTRTVTISTCPSSVSGASCTSSPLLQAVAIFDDYPANGNGLQCGATQSATCGQGMTIASWAFGMVPPTVTHVTTPQTSAACSSGKSVTLTGTGFSGATAVNFIPPGTGNTVLSVTVTGANVSNNGTNVTSCTSTLMTTGTTYQVTVTTPAGTSAPNGNSSLSY